MSIEIERYGPAGWGPYEPSKVDGVILSPISIIAGDRYRVRVRGQAEPVPVRAGDREYLVEPGDDWTYIPAES